MKAIFTELPTGVVPVNNKMTIFSIQSEIVVELHDNATDSISEIIVPEDFETDFATIPRPFRWLLPKMGRYSWAAVVHDYLLKEGFDRDFARLIFKLCLDALEVKRWRKSLLVFGVYVWDKIMVH